MLAEMHDWFVDTGVEPENVFELDWWDSVDVPPAADSKESVTIHAVPAQHNSGASACEGRLIRAGRSVHDQGSTLWCGFVVELQRADNRVAVYHAGCVAVALQADPAATLGIVRTRTDRRVQRSRVRRWFRAGLTRRRDRREARPVRRGHDPDLARRIAQLHQHDRFAGASRPHGLS